VKTLPAILAAALVPPLLACAGPGTAHAVPRVDPRRLAGTWYELARLPDNLDPDCASDAAEHYETQPGGGFKVTSSCRTPTGRLQTDVGLAWPAGHDARNAARLQVSFMPRWLQWLPLRKSEWWVVMIDPAYRYAVVSEPTGRRLRVLARTPTLPADQLGRIVDRLSAEGYQTRQLVLTKQSAVVREFGSGQAAPFTAWPRLIVRQGAARPAA
jgi:apolipoprotein D and lipocalin family protein